jgi:hypothetical protein
MKRTSRPVLRSRESQRQNIEGYRWESKLWWVWTGWGRMGWASEDQGGKGRLRHALRLTLGHINGQAEGLERQLAASVHECDALRRTRAKDSAQEPP